MAKKADLQERTEAILGKELIADLLDDVVAVRSDVGLYDVEVDGEVRGYSTSRRIGTTGASTKACTSVKLLDVSGVARTGSNGSAKDPNQRLYLRANKH